MSQLELVSPTVLRRDASSLCFTLNCLPTAQQRARHAVRKNGSHAAYKSREQIARECELEAYLTPFAPPEPMSGALELQFVALFPVPKSADKKKRAAMLCGEIGHTVKPDLDNLAKQLKDAMTRMEFWHDDRQVVRLVGEKRYGEKALWQVRFARIAEGRS